VLLGMLERKGTLGGAGNRKRKKKKTIPAKISKRRKRGLTQVP